MKHLILKEPILGEEIQFMMMIITTMNNYKKVKKRATIPKTLIKGSNKIACTVENTSKGAQEIKRLLMAGTLLMVILCSTKVRQGFKEESLKGRWQRQSPWIIK